jgi:hypothetical protein
MIHRRCTFPTIPVLGGGDRQTAGTGQTVAVATDEVDLVMCPQCRAPASIERGYWLDSTDGPVEHGRLRCAAHCGWFLALVSDLIVAGGH